MDNIVWQKPDGSVAITQIIVKGVLPEKHAAELKKRGDIPADYTAVAYNAEIPADKLFRGAWGVQNGVVAADLDAAREIAHGIRRDKRADEFKPYDDIIAKNIPGDAYTEAETARADIRARYAEIQNALDVAEDEKTLRAIMEDNGLIGG